MGASLRATSSSLSKSVPKSDLGVRMAIYRAYLVDGAGHIGHLPLTFESGDDDAAIERARQYVDGCDVDVWHHDRLVARIEGGAVKRLT
jgi:hypothetical protein